VVGDVSEDLIGFVQVGAVIDEVQEFVYVAYGVFGFSAILKFYEDVEDSRLNRGGLC